MKKKLSISAVFVCLLLAVAAISVSCASQDADKNKQLQALDSTSSEVAYYDEASKEIKISGKTKYAIKDTEAGEARVKTDAKVTSIACAKEFIAWCDDKKELYMLGKIKEGGRTVQLTEPKKIKVVPHIVEVAAGENFFIARDDKGKVWGYGDNTYGQILPYSDKKYFENFVLINVMEEAEISKVCCGSDTSGAVFTDNRAFVWGKDVINNPGKDKPLESFYQVGQEYVDMMAIGDEHLVVRTKEAAVGYGSDEYGQLSNKQDADIVHFDIKDISKIKSIECTDNATLFVMDDKLICYGMADKKNKSVKKVVEVKCKSCALSGKDLYYTDETGKIQKKII